ncbi:ADP-ribose pyrophosphatase YjhB, NUDIX family [Streptomyces sp. Ag109_G2-15]|nr:ADP-ribose pyrophosphatase YjhB, NUDIX family [Streptomyces sp. Ag109_G2-15]
MTAGAGILGHFHRGRRPAKLSGTAAAVVSGSCEHAQMTPTGHPLTASDDQPRARLLELVGAIEPWDDLERTHLESATQWIAGGAPVYRVRKPDVPAMHLVSYFVVLDHARGQLLLVAHRKAGLWLPAGGHVEPGEDPWAAVVRECREELGIEAVASPITGEHPLFLTVTRTRGQNAHTDVSLWYLLDADARTITSYDQGEFNAIRWLTDEQVLNEPAEMLDPHMHRFTRKLQHARTRRHRGQPARAVRGATRPRHVGD